MDAVIEGTPRRSFGGAFREAREEAGVSRAFIAELLGVSEAAVATWEQHTVPEPVNFEKIVHWFPSLKAFDRSELVRKRPFASHLMMLREGRNLSRDALAKLLEVSASAVRDWERDTKPRPEQLARLMKVFPELEQSSLARRRRAIAVRAAETHVPPTSRPASDEDQRSTTSGVLLHMHALVRAEVVPHVLCLLRSIMAGQCSANTLVEMLSLATGTTDSERCDG